MKRIIVNGVPAADEAEAWGMLAAEGVEPCIAVLDWNERTIVGRWIGYRLPNGGYVDARMVSA